MRDDGALVAAGAPSLSRQAPRSKPGQLVDRAGW
jgi:hypothetical protein